MKTASSYTEIFEHIVIAQHQRMNRMWKEILFRILAGEKNIPSPFDKDSIIESLFVVVNQHRRMGYAWLWCSGTFKGIWLSRIKIPENVDFVSSTEELSKRMVPKIDFVDPITE